MLGKTVIRPVAPKRQQTTGDCKIQRNNTVYTLQSAKNIIIDMKYVRLAGHVARIQDTRNLIQFCRKICQEAAPYWSIAVHGRIILNLTFNMWRCLLYLAHNTNQWRALVTTTMTLPVLQRGKDKFLTSWATIRVFSKGLNSMELCYIPKKIDTYNTRRGGTLLDQF